MSEERHPGPAESLAKDLFPPCDERFIARANVVGAWALILFAGTGLTFIAVATGGAPFAALWCLAGVVLGVVALYRSRSR